MWRAFAQRQAARKLRDACNKIILERETEPRPSGEVQGGANKDQVEVTTDVERNIGTSAEKWTLSLGFFGVMGGFEAEHPELVSPDNYVHGNVFTLTPQGVLLLFELGLLPGVKTLKRCIADKNKADSLAKGLICFQAVWMLLQTITRKASGLPVTLLELNTIAHVVCAVVLYILWWDKPQDVKEPEVIRIKELSLAAYLSRPRVLVSPLRMFEDRGEMPQENEPSCSEDGEEGSIISQTQLDIPIRTSSSNSIRSVSSKPGTPQNRSTNEIRLLRGQQLVGTNFGLEGWGAEMVCEPWVVEPLHLLSELWDPPGNFARIIFPRSNESKRWDQRHLYIYKAKSASNMEIKGNVGAEDSETWESGFTSFSDSLPTLALLSFLYGGIHLTSWNGHFPSSVEEIMWRIAGSIVASGGCIIYLLTRISDWAINTDTNGMKIAQHITWRIWKFSDVLKQGKRARTIAGLLLRMWILLYCIARVYIITEAFISLRSLPLGSYSTVNWVNFLPHV